MMNLKVFPWGKLIPVATLPTVSLHDTRLYCDYVVCLASAGIVSDLLGEDWSVLRPHGGGVGGLQPGS